MDYSLALSQNFGNLVQMAAEVKYADMEIEREKIAYEISKKRLRLDVAMLYYQWLYQVKKVELLSESTEEYADYARVARLRQETGDANKLETMLMENKYNSIHLQLHQEESMLENLTNNFNLLINGPERIIPEITYNDSSILQMHGIDTSSFLEQPYLKLLQHEISLNEQKLKIQRKGYLPELQIGYFTQQIDDIAGFNGVQAGIRFPLWFNPVRKYNQIAEIELQQSQLIYQEQYIAYQTEIENLIRSHTQIHDNINYYIQSALPNSDEIRRNANLLYQNGDIGYLEYMQSLEQALNISLEFLDAYYKLRIIESTFQYLTQ
jgi:cobalt-zinc-cadmium resistance protein CzcA